MDDETAAGDMAFYARPENQVPAGPPVRRRAPRKSVVFSIRVDPGLMERCEAAASADGMTISAWLRSLAHRELEHRAREHASEPAVVPGWGHMVTPRHIPSSRQFPVPRGTARCPHFSVTGIASVSCGTCGPLAVAA